jgi:hypothetical protein
LFNIECKPLLFTLYPVYIHHSSISIQEQEQYHVQKIEICAKFDLLLTLSLGFDLPKQNEYVVFFGIFIKTLNFGDVPKQALLQFLINQDV